jgi:hypothetical protein
MKDHHEDTQSVNEQPHPVWEKKATSSIQEDKEKKMFVLTVAQGYRITWSNSILSVYIL